MLHLCIFRPYSSDSSEDGVVFEQDEDITTNDCSEVNILRH